MIFHVYRIPTASWRKRDIQDWLRARGVEFSDDLLKPELVHLVKSMKTQKSYVVDELAAHHGHKVVRLPPYHCDLNPIEMVWSQLKGGMRVFNRDGRLEALERLLQQEVAKITPQLWESCCQHVIKLEQEYWLKDGLLDDIDSVVINMGSDSESSDDDDDDEDDDDSDIDDGGHGDNGGEE